MAGTEPATTVRLRLSVNGLVQAVGFRPFVFAEAEKLGLGGWVCNSPQGVIAEVEGPAAEVRRFRQALTATPPAHARIDSIAEQPLQPRGERTFAIRTSATNGRACTPVLPDLATCADCVDELFSPEDRRFRYPFVSCTQCGPRWSIVERLPFDREHTAMRQFGLCDRCQAEYANPRNRRFHAQTNACPDCGPQLAWLDANGVSLARRDDALRAATAALRRGLIIALKGLGGFQLLVDADNADAVARLRTRKQRPDKPLAVMFATLDELRRHCRVDAAAAAALTSAVAPIVLLPHHGHLPEALAPGNPYLGAMLPCTPLHHLLLHDFGGPLVATSGNRSGEPLCADEREAVARLAGIADRFLVHDRPILRPVDDSVVQVSMGRVQYLRRARGAAPALPARLPAVPAALAVGAHLKSTVAISAHGQCALSAHIGDLDTPTAVDIFDRRARELQDLYATEPAVVAHDAHPDYHSSRWAQSHSGAALAVQHHHAHIVATMVEHDLDGEVLGVAWDGNGLGSDGTLWGGEILRVTREHSRRLAHLRAFPLPGGALAMREPRRSAIGLLHALGEPGEDLPPRRGLTRAELGLLEQVLARGLNCPSTSAAGRLFDAIAALLDLHQEVSFEGQAAMALQHAAERADPEDTTIWPVPLDTRRSPWTLDWAPMVTGVVDAWRRQIPAASIAARVHRSLARAISECANASGLRRIALGGGCFQNRLLLELTVERLQRDGLEVYWPEQLPPNDGGLAAGQLGVAIARSNLSTDQHPT